MPDLTPVALWIDVGGTFTDVVVHDPATGHLGAFKLPSTPADHVQAILAALDKVRAGGHRIGPIIHGNMIRKITTVTTIRCTNAKAVS